jgi:hypothetical protein
MTYYYSHFVSQIDIYVALTSIHLFTSSKMKQGRTLYSKTLRVMIYTFQIIQLGSAGFRPS